MRQDIIRWPVSLTLVSILVTVIYFSGCVTHGNPAPGSNSSPGGGSPSSGSSNPAGMTPDALWQAPDTGLIPPTEKGMHIRYGRDLIAHTSRYLGPKGRVASITNGMDCQNCHLDAGSRPWGNNYSAVWSTYPKYRDRSGSVEDIEKRVNDCIQRSLNGSSLDPGSLEMRSILEYLEWLGQGIPKGTRPKGTGIADLRYLARPADPSAGHEVYHRHCEKCHGATGSGIRDSNDSGFVYPPLWGPQSYNTGAGLYRISRLAGYVKNNMPWGISYRAPQLTDEEAWDVAAFINSQPRPKKAFSKDWPDISKKPPDFPFGPYADSFTERQHKYGPFSPISHHLR